MDVIKFLKKIRRFEAFQKEITNLLEIDSKHINAISKAEMKVVEGEPEKTEKGGRSGDILISLKLPKLTSLLE